MALRQSARNLRTLRIRSPGLLPVQSASRLGEVGSAEYISPHPLSNLSHTSHLLWRHKVYTRFISWLLLALLSNLLSPGHGLQRSLFVLGNSLLYKSTDHSLPSVFFTLVLELPFLKAKNQLSAQVNTTSGFPLPAGPHSRQAFLAPPLPSAAAELCFFCFAHKWNDLSLPLPTISPSDRLLLIIVTHFKGHVCKPYWNNSWQKQQTSKCIMLATLDTCFSFSFTSRCSGLPECL